MHDPSPHLWVDPFEVEYNLNPVLFPRPNPSSVIPLTASCENIGQSSSQHVPRVPSDAIVAQAEEGQRTTRYDLSVPTINDIPHRWERTLGQDRRFFHEERDRLTSCKRRRQDQNWHSKYDTVQQDILAPRIDILPHQWDIGLAQDSRVLDNNRDHKRSRTEAAPSEECVAVPPTAQKQLPKPSVNGVPHRSEPTLGQNGRLLDAERDKLRSQAELRQIEHCSTQYTSAQKGKSRQIDIEPKSPRQYSEGISGEEVYYTCSASTPWWIGPEKNGSSSRVVPSEDQPQLVIDTAFDPTHHDLAMRTVDGRPPPAKWDLVDPPRPRIITGSSYQYHRRFSWELSFADEEPPMNLSPTTSLLESRGDYQDTTQVLEKGHVSMPSPEPLHRLRTVGDTETQLESSPISSVETSPATGSSIFSSSMTTIPSISSASSETLPEKLALQPSEAGQDRSLVQLITESVLANDPENCPDCASSFRTPGLLSAHYNRVHNRRFSCDNCSKSFGLRLDLERHKHTKHKNLFGPLVTFHCAIVGCATPGKTFHRKDNFQRHVERCKQAGVTRGTVR